MRKAFRWIFHSIGGVNATGCEDGMGLFQKSRSIVAPNEGNAIANPDASPERAAFYQGAVRSLLALIGDFSLDIKELNSPEFRQEVNLLSERFAQEEKIRSLEKRFSKEKRSILAFSQNQKRVVLDRERELKDIIEMLTGAMADLGDDNRSFAETLTAQGDRMNQISRLEDIKELKRNLQQEVDQFRKTIADKQERDRRKVRKLSGTVSSLNVELAKAKTESLTDGLTGAFNRKAFDQTLQRLAARNTVRRYPFSLLMMDIDDFKVLNDTYGHQVGDRVLMALVLKAKSLIRGEDFLARYGGEEFAVVLPGASIRNANKKARKLCKAIADARYAIDDGGKGHQIGFTVSIGVSCFRENDTSSAVLERADKALYLAKQTGKNRAVTEKELKN